MSGEDGRVTRAPIPSLAAIPDIRMTSPIVPERYDAFLRAAGAGEAFTTYHFPNISSPWADLAAVRYVVKEHPGNEPPSTRIDTLPRGVVVERPAALGRAQLFFGAVVAPDRAAAVAELQGLAKGGTTALASRVVLEPDREKKPALLAGSGSSEPRWVLDEAEEVILETDATAPGYLMLADSYYPGWRATVDSAATPIFPADIAFRAVFVPAGRHVVRFVYRPGSVGLGFALLLAASLVSAIQAVRERRRA
jgi:hypothetical protein